MTQLPESIQRAIAHLQDLPSIGPRQATRLAIYLASLPEGTLDAMSRDIGALANVSRCESCFFLHENPSRYCSICEDSSRRTDVIMVVEKETDLISLERTGKFSGRYLLLGQVPKTGILEDWQKGRIARFVRNIKSLPEEQASEIILAFSPTRIGDFAASTIARELSGVTRKLTRLGRGLPLGADIEFADEETLSSSLEGRK